MVLSRSTHLLAIVIALITSPCDAQACATTTGRAYAEVSFVLGMPVASFNPTRQTFLNGIAAALNAQLTTPNAVSEGALSFDSVRATQFQFFDEESTLATVEIDAGSADHARAIVTAMNQYTAAQLRTRLNIYVQDVRIPTARMVMNPQGAALCTSLWPTRTDIVDTISLRIALASTTITQLPAITSSGYDGFRARLAARLFGRQAEDVRIEAVRLESGVATIFVEVAAESEVSAFRVSELLAQLSASDMTALLNDAYLSGETVSMVYVPIVRQLGGVVASPPPAPSASPAGPSATATNAFTQCTVEFIVIIALATMCILTGCFSIHVIHKERQGKPMFYSLDPASRPNKIGGPGVEMGTHRSGSPSNSNRSGAAVV